MASERWCAMSVEIQGTPRDLDAPAARRLTDQIKLALDTTWEAGRRAWEGRAWIALGYESWDEYCTKEFGTSHLRLPREDRDQIIPSLLASGMPGRAVAALTGTSKGEVHRTIARAGLSAAPNGATDTADPGDVTVVESEPYPGRRASRADVITRQTKAALLRRKGLSQVEIAAQLNVGQATVSADLAAIEQLGVEVSDETIGHAFTPEGRTDVGAIASHLGVEVKPVRDLAKLARQPMLSMVTGLDVVVEMVVKADEWLDQTQRRASLEVVLPQVERSLHLMARIFEAVSAGDVDDETLASVREAWSSLGQHVPTAGGGA